MKVALIANPAARCASIKKIKEAEAIVLKEGHEAALYITGKRGDAESYAREAALRAASLVIALGGDGTFNEVINGLIGAGPSAPPPLAIVPMGTTNVLARETGVPKDVKKAIRIALQGIPRAISVGRITFEDGLSRHFCLMAGIGYDGQTAKGVKTGPLKKISGKGAYVLSGLRSLLSWNPEELAVSIDGVRQRGCCLIASKAAKYAGDFTVAPDADLREPCLYVFLMEGRRRIDILRYVFSVIAGRHLGLKDVIYARAENIRIEGKSPVQIDGDYIGLTPAAIAVVPDALRLIY